MPPCIGFDDLSEQGESPALLVDHQAQAREVAHRVDDVWMHPGIQLQAGLIEVTNPSRTVDQDKAIARAGLVQKS
jgi:hypothetical protein